MSEATVVEEIVLDEEVNVENQSEKYLTFSLGKEEYGIGISSVLEIVGIQNITELPDVPDYVKGIINLRGKVIPVLDVRLRFGMEEKEYDARTCIVVVSVNSISVGLIVDEVSEVLDIMNTQIEPAPNVHKDESHKYLQGLGKVGDEVKILLNVQKLLFDKDLELLQEVEAR